jgi:YidC/Oxa1 family membrane protein insertase
MDKDNLFKALIAAMLAFVVWNLLTQAFLPPPPPPAQTQEVITADQEAAATVRAPRDMEARGADTEQFIELGSADLNINSPFPLALRLSNRGAAMVSARLREHYETIRKEQFYPIISPVTLKADALLYSFVTESINLRQGEDSFQLDDLYWHSKHETIDGTERAVFWIEFFRQDEDQPIGRLTKTYSLQAPSGEETPDPVNLTLKYENLDDEPADVIITQLGPTGVPREGLRTPDGSVVSRIDYRRVTAGFEVDGQIAVESVQNSKIEVGSGEPLLDSDQAKAGFAWCALTNRFFAAAVALGNGAGKSPSSWTAQAVRLSKEDGLDGDLSFRLVNSAVRVPPQGSTQNSLDCYLGPKSREIFEENPVYASRNYVQLVQVDYYCCQWAPFVNSMVWLLNACHDYVPPYNYGIAIIILVIIVRTILHPLTKKSQIGMAKMAGQMATLQPKMEELRKKYASDKTRLNQETMKLYQQEGVNPAGQMMSCLPMMCQMPIWAGLFGALSSTVAMRHEPFFWWINDLTAPDALFFFDHPIDIPLLGAMIGPVGSFNLLPLLLGISMWLQQRFMPKPASAAKATGKAADQMAQQRMMMYVMSAMMVLFFYNAPSGLTLYIMASNFFGLIEQHRIRKHLREDEERGGPAVRKPVGPGDPPGGKSIRKPKFLAKLEKMAEDAKKK